MSMQFTQNEMRSLQKGQKFGPFLATRKEIHRAQANICGYKSRYPGAEFENKSHPFYREDEKGNRIKVPGYFFFEVTRTGIGISADTGEQEPIV